jgi:aldehyde dehydrogenase (NAD+)
LVLALKKVSFALAAGNTFVRKPAVDTSLIGLMIAEIFDRAGFPPGVLNVVTGPGSTLGAALVRDPRVKLISFTGSTAVGRAVAIECARHGKKVMLEMGGKSPLVVLCDADIGYAVDTACFGIFLHQGQICMAGSRIIVQAPVYEEFLERFVEKARSLKVGDPGDPKTVIGPLIRTAQCDAISDKVKNVVAMGARLLTLDARGIMGLEISIRESGDISILDLRGRSTIEGESELLSRQLKKLVGSGVRKLVLNLPARQFRH